MVTAEKLNPYHFNEFLHIRNDYNDLKDNQFIQKVAKHFLKEQWNRLYTDLQTLSKRASTEWREVANEIARRENHPTVRHYNAYNQRIDEIIRPLEAVEMEREIFSEGLFSEKTNDWERMLKRFILHHNGEAGVMCPLACTDGLVDLLMTYKEQLTPELEEILLHCTEGIDGEFGIGAQFMTEIQGGSNIPANVLQAVKGEDGFRLYGTKFFCSAIHADYSVVTARVEGTVHVATFIVPTWVDKKRKLRNGHRINRLKWKLGTSELPSAELTYDGAKAYQIGEIERGVAIAVGIVLTKSRLDIGAGSSAFMMRAVREAIQYSHFREVFGKKISDFPLSVGQLQEIEHIAKRTTAALFKVYDFYFQLKEAKDENNQTFKEKQFLLRELILLQKITASKDASEVLRTALSLFGGNGAIEDFSSIPRLYRDAMVNELWEGPRNVLLMQIHRDFKRASSWYSPEKMIEDLLEGADEKDIEYYQSTLLTFLDIDLASEATREAVRLANEWARFCDELFTTYQECALQEVGDAPIVENG